MAIIGEDKKMSIHQGKTSASGCQALDEKLQVCDKVRWKRGTWCSSWRGKAAVASAAERKGTSKAESTSLIREENEKPNKASEYAACTFVHQGHTTIVKKEIATAARRQEAIKVLSGIACSTANAAANTTKQTVYLRYFS